MAKDNDGLLISAGLDISSTLGNIKESIGKLNVSLKNKEEYWANIVGKLNVEATTSQIKAYLDSVGKNLKLDIGNISFANTNAQLDNSLKDIRNKISESVKIAPQVDAKQIDVMVASFRKAFDIKRLSTGAKSELNVLMTDFDRSVLERMPDKINEATKALENFAVKYTATFKNDEAIQRLEEFMGQFPNISSKVSASIKSDLEAIYGKGKELKKVLNEALGFGYGFGNGRTDAGFMETEYEGLHPADALSRYIDRIRELKEEARTKISKFTDLGEGAEYNKAYINNVMQSLIALAEQSGTAAKSISELNSVSGNASRSMAENFRSVISPITDVDGQIKIAYRTYDDLANKIGSDKLNNILNGWVGGSQNWSIVQNGADVTLRTVEQFEQVLSQITAVEKNMTAETNNSASAVQNLSSSVNQISTVSDSLKGVITTLSKTNDAVVLAENSFKNLGVTNANAHYTFKDGTKDLRSFEIEVKSAEGVVEKFAYKLKNIGDNQNPVLVFDLQNIESANKGVKRLADAMANSRSLYEAKLSAFKSSNSGILSGLTNEIKAVENALEMLGNGGTIADVEQRFNALTSVSSNIKRNLDTTSSSFNVVTNADNTLRQMENTLLELSNAFSTLKSKPREVSNSIKELSKEFQQLNQFETQNGRNEEWSEKYRRLIVSVKEAQNQVKLLRQTEKSDNSAAKDQAAHYRKILQEMKLIHQLKTRLISAGASESAELRTQIKQAQDRQRNAEKYIAAKQLENSELKKEVENLSKIYKNEEAITATRQKDKNNRQRTAETEQLARSVSAYKTRLDSLSASWQNQGLIVGDVQKRVDGFYASLSKIKNIDGLRKLQSEVETFKNEVSSAVSINKELAKNLEDLQKYKGSSVFTKNSGNANVQETITKIGELQTKYQQLQQALTSANSPEEIRKIGAELAQIKPQFDLVTSSAKELQTSLKETNGADSLAQKIRVLISQIEQYMAVNTKAMKSHKTLSTGNTVAVELNNMLAVLRQCSDEKTFNKISANMKVVRNEVKRLGIEGKSLWGTFAAGLKKFANWFGVSTLFMRIAHEIRGLFADVVQLDTALVDLRKTFKGTDAELKQFYFDANDVAKQLGVTTKEIIEQASAWSRLGYNTAESAKELARVSSIFKSISPGMDAEKAQSTLTSVIKAFDVDVSDAIKLSDKINVVGNNFALSNIDAADALQRSAAAMAASNTSFERTLALIVAGQEVQQDADVVGTALRSISSRIRKMNEETGEFDETLQSISGDVYELTNNRVSIMEDANTYKDIYTILKEISEVWNELTDKQHAQLLDKLFGTRQVNVGSAILQNFSQAEKALGMISDGAADGSSMREMEIIMDSVDYKANEFKETLVGIAQDSITQNFLKNMIESGTKLLETISDAAPVLNTLLSLIGELTKGATWLVKEIGLLPTIMAGLSLKNIGKLKQNTPSYAPLRLCA